MTTPTIMCRITISLVIGPFTVHIMSNAIFWALTIYTENTEILVGKWNGTNHSIWNVLEIIGYWLHQCSFTFLFKLSNNIDTGTFFFSVLLLDTLQHWIFTPKFSTRMDHVNGKRLLFPLLLCKELIISRCTYHGKQISVLKLFLNFCECKLWSISECTKNEMSFKIFKNLKMVVIFLQKMSVYRVANLPCLNSVLIKK